MEQCRKIDASHILMVGGAYKEPRGGIGQVLNLYSRYIYSSFNHLEISSFKKKAEWGRVLHTLYGLLGIPRFFFRVLLNRGIKIVHIHSSAHNSFYRSVPFILLGRVLGRKVVLHIHSGAFKDFYRSNPKIVGCILNKADGIVALSPSWATFFSEVVQKPLVRVIPNPIVLPSDEEFEGKVAKPVVRLLFLGLLTANKGVYDLLDVLSEHRDFFGGKLILQVGGNGDIQAFEKRIEELGISDLVLFHGWLSGENKKNVLLDSDVFVLPSYFEGLPMSILEALSYGLAIVSTRVGGIPDVVHEEQGILIEPGDKDALFLALKRLCESPDELMQMQSNARKEGERYSVETVATALDSLYEDILR